jgi:D-amino-acid oxidase
MVAARQIAFERRRLLQGAAALGSTGLLGLGGCAIGSTINAPGAGPSAYSVTQLAPIRATKDRLFDITVCLRPFRAAGPRLDTETIGDALIVHNYGHGGSGWSLSWGSGTVAVKKAMANSPRDTAAILAQRAGAAVTIYAMEQTPQTRSARATGSWTPDSRIALTDAAGPKFGDLWEEMARTSFKAFRSYLGLPGDPVEWRDRYNLSDLSPAERHAHQPPDPLGFAHYEDRISDLEPDFETMPPGSTPFPTPYVRRASQLQFNVADYAHTLMSDFFAAGGRFERREFHSPSELATLKEKVVINCPGYAARALWKDESIVPVRGQIGWLIPQPELTYGLYDNGVSVVSRRDGIVVQVLDGGDMRGYGDANETPDRAESEGGVATLAALFARSRANN